MRILNVLQRISLRFHTGLALIGGVWLFLAMLQVVGDVTGRYLFLKPVPATLILGEIMLVFVVYLGATYTEVAGGHIRLAVFSDRFHRRLQALLSIFFQVSAFAILVLLTWQTFTFAMESWRINEVALDFPVPLYPGKFAISVGCFFFSIQSLINLVSKVFEFIGAGKKDHE